MTGSQNKSSAGLASPLAMLNHKEIGRMFLGSSVLVLLMSLVGAVTAAFEASDLDTLSVFNNTDQFRQIWSASREGLILGGVIPAFVGLAVYLTPLQLGISRIGFGKGLAASYWTWLLGLVLLISSYVMDGGPAGERQDFVVLWTLALAMMAIGLAWAMVSVAATILASRAQGMTLARATVTTWSFLAFSVAGVMVLALLCAELALNYTKVRYGMISLDNTSSLLATFAPFSRFSSVLLICIPVLGIATEMISVHANRPIRNTGLASIPAAILVLVVVLGGSSYFATSTSAEVTEYATALALASVAAIGLVFLFNVFNIVKGNFDFNPAVAGGLVSLGLSVLVAKVALLDFVSFRFDEIGLDPLTMLTIDSDLASGRMLAAEGLYGLGPLFSLAVGAALVAIFAAIYHWSIKIWGRHIASPVAFLAIGLTTIGSVVWTTGQLWISQVADPVELSVGTFSNSGELYSIFPLIGVSLISAATVMIIASIASLVTGKVSGSASPKWTGQTLEWATTSPPLAENFPSKPKVLSAAALEDEVFDISEDEQPQVGAPSTSPAIESGV